VLKRLSKKQIEKKRFIRRRKREGMKRCVLGRSGRQGPGIEKWWSGGVVESRRVRQNAGLGWVERWGRLNSGEFSYGGKWRLSREEDEEEEDEEDE